MSCIENDGWLIESSDLSHVLEKFASMHVVKHKVDSACPLENELHVDNEWMVDLEHDESFEVDALYGIFIQDHIFADAFEGVILLSCRQICKVNFSESSSTNN